MKKKNMPLIIIDLISLLFSISALIWYLIKGEISCIGWVVTSIFWILNALERDILG
jgi:hypothetical protein